MKINSLNLIVFDLQYHIYGIDYLLMISLLAFMKNLVAKTLFTVSFFLFIFNNIKSQSFYTYVPDNNFEMYLESNGLGNGVLYDDSVSTFLISSVDELDINYLNISDLTGIENFFSLEELKCESNNLTQLNLSNNLMLEEVNCANNQISVINIGNLSSLEELNCANNSIMEIELNNLTNLEEFDCSFNQINSLNLASISSLEKLYCNNNNLNCLNMKNGNNSDLSDVIAIGNPNLSCIEVDNSTYSTFNWVPSNGFYFDSNASFSFTCPNSCDSSAQDTTVLCDSIIFIYDTLIHFDTLVFYDDTLTFYDSITYVDTVTYYDDTITYFDTVVFYDTLIFQDTNYVLIGVTDTLYIDVGFTNSNINNGINTIRAYPNPTNDILNINNGAFSNISNYELKIINGLGQSVFNNFINIPQFQIPVSVIGPPGLYFIQIFDDVGNIVVTKQLIIQ